VCADTISFRWYMQDKALRAGHSTATQAGEFARRIDAGRLVLTHFSARYDKDSGVHDPTSSKSIADLVREAKAAYGRDDVTASADFMRCIALTGFCPRVFTERGGVRQATKR
jgi:ribonuclease BN (tRNA processing enzyme)